MARLFPVRRVDDPFLTEDANMLSVEVGALRDGRGVADGIATLDAAAKVPIVQIPTGSTATTVATGNHPHAEYLTTATRGAANGVADLDLNTRVPMVRLYLNQANGLPQLDGNAKVPLAHVPTGVTATTVALGDHTHAVTQRPCGVGYLAANLTTGTTPVIMPLASLIAEEGAIVNSVDHPNRVFVPVAGRYRIDVLVRVAGIAGFYTVTARRNSAGSLTGGTLAMTLVGQTDSSEPMSLSGSRTYVFAAGEHVQLTVQSNVAGTALAGPDSTFVTVERTD